VKSPEQFRKIGIARKQRNILGRMLIVVACAGMGVDSKAGVNLISNGNFSSGLSGWVFSAGSGSQTGGTTDGAFAPTTSSYNPVPSYATTAGFLGWGPHYTQTATIETFSQVLTATLQASTIYQFTGYYGSSLNNGYSTYSSDATPFVELLAGSTVIASANLTTPPTQGSFDSWTLNYNSTGSSYVGDTLEIVLGLNINGNQNSNGAGQVDFADIQLQTVPEPVNMALAMFGILTFGGIATRRWIGRNALRSEAVGL
jgi:hypothetical protein